MLLGLMSASMNSRTIQEKVSHFLTGKDTYGAFIKGLYLLLQNQNSKNLKMLQLNNIVMPVEVWLSEKVAGIIIYVN